MNKLCPVELSEENDVTLQRTEEFVKNILAKNVSIFFTNQF